MNKNKIKALKSIGLITLTLNKAKRICDFKELDYCKSLPNLDYYKNYSRKSTTLQKLFLDKHNNQFDVLSNVNLEHFDRNEFQLFSPFKKDQYRYDCFVGNNEFNKSKTMNKLLFELIKKFRNDKINEDAFTSKVTEFIEIKSINSDTLYLRQRNIATDEVVIWEIRV